jgi:integrase
LYEGTIARLCHYFGDTTLLRQITAQSAEMFLAELRPKQGDKVLSSWTRSQILRQCKTLFGDAESRDFIARNPFKKLRGPKTSVTAWYYLDRGEYRKLLDVTPSQARQGLREQALYALCYTAGLRLTEAVAVRWPDIDFETGQVQVVRYAATDTWPPFDIKDNELRSIPLPQQTIDLLLRVQAEAPDKVPYALMSKRRYERVVAKWQACRAEGRAWFNRDYGNNVLTRFKRRIRRAGIKTGGKTLTIHTLRKCCCQNWIQDGQPINVVKMLMGHADIGTTERHYSQVTEAQRQQVADRATARLQTPAAEAGADATDLKRTFSPDFACPEAGDRR